MTAEQFLTLAETLRSYAQHSGRDVNASHMFVHAMLMRAIQHDAVDTPERAEQPRSPKAKAA